LSEAGVRNPGNWSLTPRRVGARGLQLGVPRGQTREVNAGCPHPAGIEDAPREGMRQIVVIFGLEGQDAGGVGADSPGLARERLPGVWWWNRHAPRRRCEDWISRVLQPLPGLVSPWERVTRGCFAPRAIRFDASGVGPRAMRRSASVCVEGKVAHAKTQRRKGGNRMCCVLVSLRLERSGREELGTGNWCLTRAAWGHAAFNREFPEASCHGLGTGDWGLGTAKKTGFQGGGSSVGCGVRGR
jgi:hypothetical protein